MVVMVLVGVVLVGVVVEASAALGAGCVGVAGEERKVHDGVCGSWAALQVRPSPRPAVLRMPAPHLFRPHLVMGQSASRLHSCMDAT